MALFGKKEEVPKIPPSPVLPELPKLEPKQKKELPELPTFPSGIKNNNLNQEMVKSAVTDMSAPGEKEEKPSEQAIEAPKEELIPQKPAVPKPSQEFGKISSPPKEIKPALEPIIPKPISPIPSLPSRALSEHPKPQGETIFIRIDKFQDAQKSFEEIKGKVGEIEEVLDKIKEVKAQEEEELKGWIEDVEKIKLRLSEIDEGIFNQV